MTLFGFVRDIEGNRMLVVEIDRRGRYGHYYILPHPENGVSRRDSVQFKVTQGPQFHKGEWYPGEGVFLNYWSTRKSTEKQEE